MNTIDWMPKPRFRLNWPSCHSQRSFLASRPWGRFHQRPRSSSIGWCRTVRCASAAFHTRLLNAATKIANRARNGRRGGRPPGFDVRHYETRNQVERLMNHRKQFRAMATRYDKLNDRHRATVQIADIFIWLRANPDRSARRVVRHGCTDDFTETGITWAA